ncbi:phosphoinositide-specific phospholipase C [Metarhizium album ARSEF 1941]|uniref:Phosphoinositide phospholipase C n=1 Tax=Metarhizium album (strain ARSEF 1941) TaxID=1081103 RepID=A0A0B2WHX3_METAS|nr:phosphoinositide-specific phospholipase C [Metarhizium album ARSEF 1941]KHN95626.1 phosphoinositide-specific phospholipase C [Metarhizium album ARSEF 1941]
MIPGEPETQQTTASPSVEQRMSALSPQLRRSRPGHVQTTFNSNSQPVHVADSEISASSAASSSQQGSPIMSPGAAVLTTNSSIQASPEPLGSRDDDQFSASFQLPDSILTHKTSNNSLSRSWVSSTSPIVEVAVPELRSNSVSATSIGTAPTATTSKGNLIRRLSSRASRRLTSSRRRQSSATPASRDGSIGPCFLRRRSDSNNTAPPDYVPTPSTDSESDLDERDDLMSIKSSFLDQIPKGSSANSTTGSISGSANNMAGPVIPLQLQRGTWLRKISKKNRSKRICLVYERETNKLVWDQARPHKFLHVDEIREIRFESDIQQYARDFNIPEPERLTWFTILYTMPDKSKSKLMHLMADSVETTNLWINFLDAMMRHRQDVMTALMTFNDKAIQQYWQSEMTKKFGDSPRNEEQEELDITGVMRVCQNLHIYSSQSTLQANFRLADARHCDALRFQEFLDFVRLMRQRPDVQRLIRSIAAKPGKGLTFAEFLSFLKDYQGEDVEANKTTWERHFNKFVRKYRSDDLAGLGILQDDLYMSEAAFIGFLSSRQSGPLVEEPQQYTLDRPMNEYFISSSHNTYLLGRQVAGQSSVEGYIRALAQGCRCVEVDCWDGSDGQPQVVHGRTLTSAISFKEVMTTINKYAFVKSSFPLWISLEVHCSPSQQALMVDIMKDAFGSRLVTEPLDPSSDKLPSPSELMEKILIKVKKPRGGRDETLPAEPTGRRRGSSLSSPVSKPAVPDSGAFSPSQSVPQSPLLPASNQARRLVSKSRVNTIAEGEVHDIPSSSTSDNESGSEMGGSIRRSQNKTTRYLGALGVYCAGVKFFGFEDPAAKTFNHIFSFMETSFAKHSRTKDAKMALDIHNMRYLMRVYPDGLRLASSNFDPLIYWRRGVQMAALNWQTFDSGMQLNNAMFQGGKDESGYVLKPDELRDIQIQPYNSAIAEGKKERSVVRFAIEVISAQQLMRPANLAANKSMDTYVEVEIFHANDKRDKKEIGSWLTHALDSPLKFQTDVVRENGFNPVFTGGPFKFTVTTKHPELIFVRWSVKLASYGESYNSKEGSAIATYTAKLKNLKGGYRTIPLHNHAGDQYLFSTLFCRINVEPIETKLFDIATPVQDGGKLNRFGGKVFGRTNTSPRSTFEKSITEKNSFDNLV